jgi:hypothetical protein
VFVFLFGVLEHVVEGLFHREGWSAILHDLLQIGLYELIARVIMLIVAFIPFFAVWELGRVIGMRKLSALFFSRQGETSSAGR